MANPINNDYSEAVISTINAVRLENRLVPIWLGSEAGPDGGTGGRPGGYIGKLSQRNVAYDTTEAATLSTSGSGSLLDNLNHIRYRVQAVENILGSGGGSFLGLTDVGPESYAGYAGYIVSVNDEEDGLEFINMSDGGASSFLELTDTPSTYAGEAGKAAVVNDAENALEFVEMLTETDVSANMLVNSNFILSLSSDNSPVYWDIDLGSGAQAYADYGIAGPDTTYYGPLLTIWPSSSEVTRVSQKVHIRTGLNTPAPFQNWFGSAGRVKFGAMVRAYWFGGGAPPSNAVRLFATNGVSTNYSSYVMDDGEWHFVTVTAPSMFTHTNYEFGIEVAGVTNDYGIYVTNAIVTMRRDLVDGQPYWVAHPQDFNNVLHLPDFDNDPATPPANTQILYSKGDNLYKMNSAGEVTLLGSGGAVDVSICQGRLTSHATQQVSNSSGSEYLYWLPYTGNQIALYDGSEWGIVTFSAIAYDVTGLSTDTVYDVFAYNNSGTVSLELVAWASKNPLSTSLAQQDGVYIKSGEPTRRYLGTIWTDADLPGLTTGDGRNGIWNYYNRLPVQMQFSDKNSHTYTTEDWREWGGGTARLEFVSGVDDEGLFLAQWYAGVNFDSGDAPIKVGLGQNFVGSDATYFLDELEVNDVMDARYLTNFISMRPYLGANYFVLVEYGGSPSPDFTGGGMTFNWWC